MKVFVKIKTFFNFFNITIVKCMKYIIFICTLQVEETEDKDSDLELYDTSDEGDSSDEDRSWVKEVKKQHKFIRNKTRREDDSQPNEEQDYTTNRAPRTTNIIKSISRVSKASLGDRLAKESFSTMVTNSGGNREMRFSMRGKKSESDNNRQMKKHHQERKQFVRRTGFLLKKKSF